MMSSIANSLLLLLNDKMRIAMDKPLFVECHNALEYNYLFKDVDNMNFYSAKMDENEYIVVDDFDCDNYDSCYQVQIFILETDRLICRN